MYYELTIDQECRITPRHDSWSTWRKDESKHATIDEVKERIIEIYGKIPFRKGNEIYLDKFDDKRAHVGYWYCYWEYYSDRSLPPNAKYWARDWISVMQVTEEPAVELITLEDI